MRHLAMPKMRLAAAVILVAAGLVSLFALAQQRQQQSQGQPQTSAPITADDLNKSQLAASIAVDPKVMPDIVGIHLGMTLRDAAAALQAAYPSMKITAQPTKLPTIDKPVAFGLTTAVNNSNGDVVNVGVVLPPNRQIVWEVDRTTGYVPGQQPMNRGTLLAALRQKYGKESYSSTSREGASVRNDRDIADIYWMFDEKGSRLPLPNPTFGQPGYPGCEGRPGTRNVPNAPGQDGSNASAYSTEAWGAWCTSVYVGVHLHLQPETSDPDNLIQRVSTDMIDIPLAMRAQKATVDWYHNIGEKQHQLDIQKSKQVQPKL